jgi:hypothetical protein
MFLVLLFNRTNLNNVGTKGVDFIDATKKGLLELKMASHGKLVGQLRNLYRVCNGKV